MNNAASRAHSAGWRVQLVVLALALLTALVGPVGRAAAADDTALTFDWPLDCTITVEQTAGTPPHSPATRVVHAVSLSEGGMPGNLLVRFGEARVLELADRDGQPVAISPGATSAFLTNPTIEIDRRGVPVAYGYEEWSEDRVTALEDPVPADLLPPVQHRVGIATWPTWVSLWAQLGAVDGAGSERSAPVSFLDEDGSPFTVELTVTADVAVGGSVGLYGRWELDDASAAMLVLTDPTTLRPSAATFEYALGDPAPVIDRYDWNFDWSACDEALTVSELPPPATVSTTVVVTPPTTHATATASASAVTVPGFATIHIDELPPEARDTLALIAMSGPFPYRQDDAVFENRERLLPAAPRGYYREFTVVTPGAATRGARRIVTGAGGEMFYTDDHYDSFRVIVSERES